MNKYNITFRATELMFIADIVARDKDEALEMAYEMYTKIDYGRIQVELEHLSIDFVTKIESNIDKWGRPIKKTNKEKRNGKS